MIIQFQPVVDLCRKDPESVAKYSATSEAVNDATDHQKCYRLPTESKSVLRRRSVASVLLSSIIYHSLLTSVREAILR